MDPFCLNVSCQLAILDHTILNILGLTTSSLPNKQTNKHSNKHTTNEHPNKQTNKYPNKHAANKQANKQADIIILYDKSEIK